jgi:hypothetical protein
MRPVRFLRNVSLEIRDSSIYVKVKAVLTSRGQYLTSARDMLTIVSTQYLVANTF